VAKDGPAPGPDRLGTYEFETSVWLSQLIVIKEGVVTVVYGVHYKLIKLSSKFENFSALS